MSSVVILRIMVNAPSFDWISTNNSIKIVRNARRGLDPIGTGMGRCQRVQTGSAVMLAGLVSAKMRQCGSQIGQIGEMPPCVRG